jgi:hypothetical protein
VAEVEFERNRRLLIRATDWWEEDRNRLGIIRFLAYALFLTSIIGTIYSGIKGALPIWAVTLYVLFAVELVFLTFMYAIRHSGKAEIRRAIFDLRLKRQSEWEFQRAMLAEFTRLTACLSAGIDPTMPDPHSRRGRLVVHKLPLPSVDKHEEAKALIRAAVMRFVPEQNPAGSNVTEHPRASEPDAKRIDLQFIAYSSETLIELSRTMMSELDDILTSSDLRLDGVEIHVRILIRDTSPDTEWMIPLARSERADQEYAADLRTRFRNVQRSELKRFEETLKDLTSQRQVHFLVRGYQAEPLIKGIMVDGYRGMFGIYTVSDLQDPPGWDYSGHDIDFCRAAKDGNQFESAAAQFFNDWFELMWDGPNSRSVER